VEVSIPPYPPIILPDTCSTKPSRVHSLELKKSISNLCSNCRLSAEHLWGFASLPSLEPGGGDRGRFGLHTSSCSCGPVGHYKWFLVQ
jgi:hypothetical protein